MIDIETSNDGSRVLRCDRWRKHVGCRERVRTEQTICYRDAHLELHCCGHFHPSCRLWKIRVIADFYAHAPTNTYKKHYQRQGKDKKVYMALQELNQIRQIE